MYRKRNKYSAKLANMRSKKKCIRLESEAPEYPVELPRLRRKIIIIDYDFGVVKHEIKLYRTNRIDCYRAVADGNAWKERIGWSRVVEILRKSFIRVQSPYTI